MEIIERLGKELSLDDIHRVVAIIFFENNNRFFLWCVKVLVLLEDGLYEV